MICSWLPVMVLFLFHHDGLLRQFGTNSKNGKARSRLVRWPCLTLPRCAPSVVECDLSDGTALSPSALRHSLTAGTWPTPLSGLPLSFAISRGGTFSIARASHRCQGVSQCCDRYSAPRLFQSSGNSSSSSRRFHCCAI